jgi:hypothetical protein
MSYIRGLWTSRDEGRAWVAEKLPGLVGALTAARVRSPPSRRCVMRTARRSATRANRGLWSGHHAERHRRAGVRLHPALRDDKWPVVRPLPSVPWGLSRRPGCGLPLLTQLGQTTEPAPASRAATWPTGPCRCSDRALSKPADPHLLLLCRIPARRPRPRHERGAERRQQAPSRRKGTRRRAQSVHI